MSTVVGNPVIAELALEEVGTALTSKASVLNALAGKGFRYCRLKTPAGTYSTIVPSGSWAEDGTTGVYRITVTATGVEGTYSAVIVYAESGHASQTFGWEEQVVTAAQADPASVFTTVTVSATVDPSTLRITLHRGDDETLPWTVTSPDLTGASATLRIFRGSTDVLTKAASISGTTITVSLTAVETAALSLGTPAYRYELICTLAGGAIRTVASGDVWVRD